MLAALSNTFASIQSALTIPAIAALLVYFVLFFRLVNRHPEDIATLRADGFGRRVNLLLTPIVLTAVVAPIPYKAVAIGIGAPLLIGFAWAHHNRLKRLGVNATFLRKMAALSCLAIAALATLAIAALLGASSGVAGS